MARTKSRCANREPDGPACRRLTWEEIEELRRTGKEKSAIALEAFRDMRN